jgi:hypothetical protein
LASHRTAEACVCFYRGKATTARKLRPKPFYPRHITQR